MYLGEVVCYIEFLLDYLAVTSSAAVEICPVLISDLAPRLAAAILSPLNEPRVPVSPDDPVVQPSAIDVPQRVLSVLSAVILHETEATGRPLELVQPHHHPLHLPALAEQLVDLGSNWVQVQVQVQVQEQVQVQVQVQVPATLSCISSSPPHFRRYLCIDASIAVV